VINGTTGGLFLDDGRFESILAEAERLGALLYLHPALPPRAIHETYFSGLAAHIGMLLAGAAWGWHQETALHALRMIAAGCFDRHPDLKVIIGHMGEMLPFQLARIDQLLSPELTRLDRRVSEYLLGNFWLTTSGFFTEPPLRCALSVVGADRILFSVDYPFSPNQAGRTFIDSLSIGEADRQKIAFLNAERLLGVS
jgi:predicted TIM-barrel fold metal-dependent hydrolase